MFILLFPSPSPSTLVCFGLFVFVAFASSALFFLVQEKGCSDTGRERERDRERERKKNRRKLLLGIYSSLRPLLYFYVHMYTYSGRSTKVTLSRGCDRQSPDRRPSQRRWRRHQQRRRRHQRRRRRHQRQWRRHRGGRDWTGGNGRRRRRR